MIYVVLNLVMAAFMVGLAFYTDNQIKEDVENPLVPMDIFLAISLVFMALTIWASEYAPERLMLFFIRLSLVSISVYAIDFCIYCISFPSYSRPMAVRIIKWLLVLFGGW